MPIKVIVNGAQGKMGALACKTIAHNKQFKLVAGLTRGDDLAQAITASHAAIVIDFTNHHCVYANCLCIIQCGAHPIIGTTGLFDKQIIALQQLALTKALGGIIAPNFSISALLMMRFAAEAAKFFPEVEIIEAHHQHKTDAPSGTAIKTAELLAAARCKPKKRLVTQELLPGARGGSYHDINIHSIRLPGLLARQEIIFGNQGETLSINHNSITRSAFMPGMILACQRVTTLTTLIYGLESLLI